MKKISLLFMATFMVMAIHAVNLLSSNFEQQSQGNRLMYSDQSSMNDQGQTITIRLNPYSIDWSEAFFYAWTGSTYYYSSSSTIYVAGQKMILAEDGWWTYSFESPGTTFYVGFDYQSDNSPIYDRNANNSNIVCSVSTCFEINTGSLQRVEYVELAPNESNTYVVHVASEGTFGQLMVQKLGDMTWTDIASLTVTGLMNDDDISYLSRMTNLQQLDLSGTNITYIEGLHSFARLSKVVLPTSCIIISAYAFQNCLRLVSINLDNVQFIDEYAFQYCTALDSLSLPLATEIGTNAFSHCTSLVQANIPKVTSLGTYAFAYDSKLEQVLLSDHLEIIPSDCFYSCSKLTSITLPASLKEIGSYALNTILYTTLPEGVLKVGNYNFINATSINIPSTVTSWSSFSNTWKHVYCDVIVPPAFSVFNTSNVSDDTLHVPAISLAAYKLHDYWYQFGQIASKEGNVSELNINGGYTLLTTDGISDKANITVNSGGELKLSLEDSMALGKYVQQISSITKKSSKYIDGDYIYNASLQYNGMLMVNSLVTADSVIIRYVPKSNQWNFFSLPFDVHMRDIAILTQGLGTAGTSQWVIREYSGANRASGNGTTWNDVPTNGMLNAHKGYILYWVVENSGTYLNNSSSSSVTLLYYFNMPAASNNNMQNIFATGDVNVPLTEYSAEFPQNRSWNLIGNPYPCSFNIMYMDLEAPITTWNGNTYVAYSIEDDNYMLRPAEAFFVQAPQGTSQITFYKEGRSAVNNQEVTKEIYNNIYASKRIKVNNQARKVFNFTLSNADYSDRARLVLNENASADYELTRDAAKMMSSDNAVPQLFINNNGIRYAIDERPEQSIYTIGAYFGTAGEYTLHLNIPENEDRQILLIDTETQTTTNLSLTDYTFIAGAGLNENRFLVSFVKEGMERTDETSLRTTPTKTIQSGQLFILKNDKTYNVQGQIVK